VGFRHWLRVLCAAATLLLIAAPVALGAAMGPVLRELGMTAEHKCKCNMPAGTCGCPECAKLEQVRLSERRAGAVPHLRGLCDDDAPAFPSAAAPSPVLPSLLALLPVPRGERTPVNAATPVPIYPSDEPPVPPPRIATA
jgi:hypothetical protein